MKSKLILVLAPLLLSLVACGKIEESLDSKENSIGESSHSEESTSKEESTTLTISEEPSGEDDTYNLTYNFDETSFNKGTKISGEDGKNNLNKLLEDINKTDFTSPYESSNATGAVFFNEWGNESGTTLILGSQGDSGSITFSSHYSIVSYTIEYQAYWKYIAYNDTYSMDGDTTLVINDESHEIVIENNNEAPKLERIQKEITSYTNSITLNNLDAKARVLIHSLTIEFIYTGAVSE